MNYMKWTIQSQDLIKEYLIQFLDIFDKLKK